MTFFVVDADLAVEDLLIPVLVLQRLGVNAKTPLKDRPDLLDGFDYFSVGAFNVWTQDGQVSRLLFVRPNRLSGSHMSPNTPLVYVRHRVRFFKIMEEQDPFADSAFLNPCDSIQLKEIKVAVDNTMELASSNEFSYDKLPKFWKLFFDLADPFRTSFSSDSPAKIPPLKADLVPDARPVCVRFRSYFLEQRGFLSRMVEKLFANGLAYSNSSSLQTCTPISSETWPC